MTAVRRVVLRARTGVETNGLEALPLVDEGGCQHFTIPQELAVPVEFFIQDVKAVTAAYVEHKIDIPTEYIGQLHDHGIAETGGFPCEEQGGLDNAFGLEEFGAHLSTFDFGLCPAITQIDQQVALVIERVPHSPERSVLRAKKCKLVARLNLF